MAGVNVAAGAHLSTTDVLAVLTAQAAAGTPLPAADAALAGQAATKRQVDAADALKADAASVATSLGLKVDATPSVDINANSHKVVNLATPTASTDATTKAYVDALAQGLSAKGSCVAATTANITLSGAQTIDGISVVATNRVLVKNQTTASQNGIYVAAAGAWARATDMDTWAETQGAYALVTGGSTQATTGWVSQTVAGGTLDTTAITFAQFNAASSVSSVFGRVGAVVGASGDYAASQVTNDSAVAGTGVAAAINSLNTSKAPLASPTFTGTVTVPTPSPGDSSTKSASTAFVAAALAASVQSGAITSTTQSGAPATALTASQAQIGTTATITPKSTASKVLLVARIDLTKDATATKRTVTVRLWRGAVASGTQVGPDVVVSSDSTGEAFQAVVAEIDGPATTAATSYRLSAAGDVTTTVTAARYEIQAVELAATADPTLVTVAAAWNGTNTQSRNLQDLRRDWVTLSDYTGSSTPGECHTALLNALQATEFRHVLFNKGDWTLNTQTSAVLGRDKIVHCEGAKFTYTGANVTYALRIIANSFDLTWEGGEIDAANKAAQALLLLGRTADMLSGLSRAKVTGLTSRNAWINTAIGDLSANLYVLGGFEEVELRNAKLLGSSRTVGAAVSGSFGCTGYCTSVTAGCYVRRNVLEDVEVRDVTFPDAVGSGNDADCDGIAIHCPGDVTDAFFTARDIRGENVAGRLLKSQCSQNDINGWSLRHPTGGANPKQGGLEGINLQYGGGTIKNGRMVIESLGTGNKDASAISVGVSGLTGTLGVDTFVDGLSLYNGTATKLNAALAFIDPLDIPRVWRIAGVSVVGPVGTGCYIADTSNASTRPLVMLAQGWRGNWAGFLSGPGKMIAASASTYATVHAQSCLHTGGSAVPVIGNYDGATANGNATVTASGCRNLTASWG